MVSLPPKIRASTRRMTASWGGRVADLAGLVAVLAIVLAAPTHQFLAHGHASPAKAVQAAEADSGCGHAHHGCGDHHHAGPAAPGTDAPAPCDHDGEGCDTCTLLAGSPTWSSPEMGDHPRPEPSGIVFLHRGTTREIWDPSEATSRGPPRA